MCDLAEWYAGNITLQPSCARIKKFLIAKHGPICAECGWSGKNPFTGRWIVDLDHVDGNHGNYHPSNFRLLCPNCHAMTPTYKALNSVKAKTHRGAFSPLSGGLEDY
jgi:5-methylcytosine-specific restriction endonuclease McrA